MDQWEIYEVLKGNRGLTEQDIFALEKEPAWIFKEAVIEYLLMKARIHENACIKIEEVEVKDGKETLYHKRNEHR